MKLQNMPVPLSADMVDEYMRPVLEEARDGDLALLKHETLVKIAPRCPNSTLFNTGCVT